MADFMIIIVAFPIDRHNGIIIYFTMLVTTVMRLVLIVVLGPTRQYDNGQVTQQRLHHMTPFLTHTLQNQQITDMKQFRSRGSECTSIRTIIGMQNHHLSNLFSVNILYIYHIIAW
jgi:hypothetical protein